MAGTAHRFSCCQVSAHAALVSHEGQSAQVVKQGHRGHSDIDLVGVDAVGVRHQDGALELTALEAQPCLQTRANKPETCGRLSQTHV